MTIHISTLTETPVVFEDNLNQIHAAQEKKTPPTAVKVKPFARHAVRMPTTIKAYGCTPDNRNTICIIRDLSTSGAKLELPSGDINADEFVLFVAEHKIALKCKRIWRRGAWIGVQFEKGRPDLCELMMTDNSTACAKLAA